MPVSLEVMLILVMGLLIAVGLIVLLVKFLRKMGRPQPASASARRLNGTARADMFREKSGQFREEQSRILGMVESGKISAAEGERLLDTLTRETTTMACPFCNEDIRVEAVKCRHCGSYLYEDISGPKRLVKSREQVLSGVCGGLAEYFELDPTLVRILTVIIAFFLGIFGGLIIYLVAALVIPEPGA